VGRSEARDVMCAGAASGHVRELTISIREVVPAICGH